MAAAEDGPIYAVRFTIKDCDRGESERFMDHRTEELKARTNNFASRIVRRLREIIPEANELPAISSAARLTLKRGVQSKIVNRTS